MEVEAVVVSVGKNAFTVNVPQLGLTDRLYLDKIPGTTSTFDEMGNTILLQATSPTANGWTTATLGFLSKVVVGCFASPKAGPVVIQLQFLWPK